MLHVVTNVKSLLLIGGIITTCSRQCNAFTIPSKISFRNGPISAFVDAMRDEFGLSFRLADFGQNTRSATSKAEAAAYVELLHDVNDTQYSVFGVGIDTSITLAPIRAVVSAINKLATQ